MTAGTVPQPRETLQALVPAETVAQLTGRDMMVGRFAELLGLRT